MMNLFDMTKKDLQDFLVAQGMKKFRADQIFHYIYKQSVFSWDDMVLLLLKGPGPFKRSPAYSDARRRVAP